MAAVMVSKPHPPKACEAKPCTKAAFAQESRLASDIQAVAVPSRVASLFAPEVFTSLHPKDKTSDMKAQQHAFSCEMHAQNQTQT